MKRIILIVFGLLFISNETFAFCGFYVAKADATLFNKASQVIIARNGNHTVITMFSDYQGAVKDFAMVVPVPVILKREQIKTISKALFSKLDAYTGPRLVEYHDESPCTRYLNDEIEMDNISSVVETADWQSPMKEKRVSAVKIEARYEVDEYEILILSSTESSGLETWLNENGYKIPKGASEVLEPYIKTGMKFFVAKVNLKKFDPSGKNELNPLQISFDSPKFMLPIRLGMANAAGDQDLIVYTLTPTGRVETVNYRTAQMPSNRNIPEYVASNFGGFYQDVYSKAWNREDKTSVLLEYAWNISGSAPVKCDPCPQTEQGPLTTMSYQELTSLGVDWVTTQNNYNYLGNLFVTRLHARYNRSLYPQDLVFQETANRENFQSRYVINHPAYEFDCDEGQAYLKTLITRRNQELLEVAYLSGWSISDKNDYVDKYKGYIQIGGKSNDKDSKNFFLPFLGGNGPGTFGGGVGIWVFVVLFLLLTGLILKIPSTKKVVV